MEKDCYKGRENVKKILQPKKGPKSPKLDGPNKAPKSLEFVDTDSSTEDE